MHSDFIAYWVPHYKFILDELIQGKIPLWQPYSYLGVPELFKLELVFFYPPTWIVLLINIFFNRDLNLTFIGKSLELMQYFNLVMGAMGMYLLLKKNFNLHSLVAFGGGMVFVLSQYITIQSGDLSSLPGKLLLPWLTLLLLNFIDKQSFKNYFAVVCANILLFTLGYPYNFVYFFLAQAGLAAFFGPKKFFYTGVALVNAALLAGFLLFPNWHILSQSFRGVTSSIDDPFFHFRYALIPTKIISIFNPLVFGSLHDKRDPLQLFSMGMLTWGVIPLIFLCIGFVHLKLTKLSTWFVLLFIFGIIISLGGYLNAPYLLGLIFPVIEKFRSHLQLLSLTFFAGTVILSQGMDATLKGEKSTKTVLFLWQLAVLTLVMFFWLPFVCKECTTAYNDVMITFTRSVILLIIGLVLFHLTLQTKKIIFIVVGLIITLFESSFYAYHIPYLRMETSYSDYYQPNSLLIERSSNDNLFRYQFNENQFVYNTSFLKIFNTQGYETVPYQAYYSLSRFGEEKMLQFTNTKYLVTTEENKEKKLPSLKLIKTIIPSEHPDEVFYGTVDGLVYFSPQENLPYYIYEVTNYLPRFFVPKKVVSCPNEKCYEKENPVELTYVTEGGIDITNPSENDVIINILSYEPNEIILEVTSPTDTFIASSEIWDKGWSVVINDKKSSLYNTSNGFRGFLVPSGKSTVTMTYFPPLLFMGLGVSAVGILMLLSYQFVQPFLERKLKKIWE